MIEPEQCRTMAEVRAGVDEVDDEIVRLLGRRFRFMDAAARIKQDRDRVRDERRKSQVIERVRNAANEALVPETLIANLYEQLIEGSIAYELLKFDALRVR
jgi:isochorismate pyruvate lyase